MTDRKGLTYRDAGVDIDSMDRALEQIRGLAASTSRAEVLSELGSFGGLFAFPHRDWREPVLVSSVDGVGTKMKVALMAGRLDTVGRDLVNHCVNDILVQGAHPLFFLDYVAGAGLDASRVVSLVEGVARGCREHGCALIGGETAEMPGVYEAGEYDLAGTIVGVVEKSAIIDGSRISDGDVLLGLGSAGLHTNGFSLARKVFFETLGWKPDRMVESAGKTIADLLLAEHRSYYHVLSEILEDDGLHGLAHVTGGGITDNLPRILPDSLSASVQRSAWPVPAVFEEMRDAGGIADEEMFRTFNMGIGMILVVDSEAAVRIERHMESKNETCHRIGVIGAMSRGRDGSRRVHYD